MNSHFWDLKKLSYKAAEKSFHDKLAGVIEPLTEMFTPKTPLTPEAEVVIENETKDGTEFPPTPSPETAIATISWTRSVEEDEHIPLVLRTMQELKQENEVVRSRLDKQDDMFKEQGQTNTKIKRMLQAILSRFLSPP